MSTYALNLWGSHPDENNDDCWTGIDVATRAEAEAIFCAPDPLAALKELAPRIGTSDATHIELDGPSVNKVRELRQPRPRADSGEWKHEAAMQAGMAFGCEGYNDEMGW